MKKGLKTHLSRYSYRLFWVWMVSIWLPSGLQAQTQLDSYLEKAASQNLELKSKYNLYLAALERVNHAGTLPDPTVSFAYFISPVETRVGPQRLRFSLRQMFPWMGTLKAREKVAAGQAKVMFEEFEAARNRLFKEVKDKWLELYELQKEEEIMRANLSILKTYEPVTRTKYEANLVSLADLVRVQISIDNARVQLELLGLKKQPLVSDFKTLLNEEADLKILLSDSLSVEHKSGYEADAIQVHQPEVKALQAALVLMDDRLNLSHLKHKPQIGFGLDYGFVGKRENVVVDDNGRDFIAPTVTLSLPIFRKKNESARRALEFEKESVVFKMEALDDALQNAWENAAYEMNSAARETALYGQEIEKTQALLRILTSEYTNNHRDFEDLLATQQQLLQLRLVQIRATVKYYRGLYKKDYLTGYTLNRMR